MQVLSREQVVEMVMQLPPEQQSEAAKLALELYGEAPQHERFADTRYDPKTYIETNLGWSPWSGTDEKPGQKEILDAYVLALRQQHEKQDYENGILSENELTCWQPGQLIKNIIRVEAGHTVGKCVGANEMITLSNGARVQAFELVGKEFELLTLVEGNVKKVRAKAELNRIEPVYELITNTGKHIIRNAEHPLYIAKGIFQNGRRPFIDNRGFTPLADIQVGDLIAVAESLPAFGRADITDCELKLIAYLLGDGGYTKQLISFSQQDNKQLQEFKKCADEYGCKLTQISKYDWMITGQNGRGKNRNNPILNLLRQHEMANTHSRDKRIPEVIFHASKEQLCLFLSRLFATDGWACVSKNGHREIGFCSSSKGLIEDISHLLQKLGVHCRISKKTKVNAWSLLIMDACDQMMFIEQIGIFGKEKGLATVELEASRIRDKKYIEIAKRPDRPRWCHKNTFQGTRWEKVVAVNLLETEQQTVAIEVPEYETFLTSFYEHNTKVASGLVNHFFDSFVPAIIYTFAPTFTQIHDLLWKEIKTDRRGKGLPGTIQDVGLKVSDNHFAVGRATSDAGGRGTERVQGQHGKYLMFVIDEAEGVADYVFNAIKSMTSGGISIVLMLANPKTRSSRFHKVKSLSNVHSLRMSCIHHPNVIAGKEIVPDAVKRDYVSEMMEEHVDVVKEHNEDEHTFELDFDIRVGDKFYPKGTVFKPDAEFMFRVLGIAPANIADDTLITVGRFEAACKRVEPINEDNGRRATMGVDGARWGKDFGTLYIRHMDYVWREKQFSKQTDNPTKHYISEIKKSALRLHKGGVIFLHIRVDAAYGSGVIDGLRSDDELIKAFVEFRVIEVSFGSSPFNKKAYYDLVTEMYAETAETIKAIKIVNPPSALEEDLCERKWEPRNVGGRDVKKLEAKVDFRKRVKRSPDDGDGFVLCVAPDFLFGKGQTPTGIDFYEADRESPWT